MHQHLLQKEWKKFVNILIRDKKRVKFSYKLIKKIHNKVEIKNKKEIIHGI